MLRAGVFAAGQFVFALGHSKTRTIQFANVPPKLAACGVARGSTKVWELEWTDCARWKSMWPSSIAEV
ncbi:hypothetical protein AWB71_00171 [Caballeronia peredens]|nr:hypothetical protein AWB71_00171 [Caballeronia peredens]